MKILLATPCFGSQVYADYVGSLLNSLKWCASQKIEAELYFHKGSSSIGSARNTCASYALERKCDKLFFLDADQVWTDEQFALIAQSKQRLVGGTYCKKQHPLGLNFNPTDADFAKYGAVQDPIKFQEWALKEADPVTGEVAVKHIPTGFMMIDCSLLEELKPHCPSYLSPDVPGEEEKRHWDFFPSGVLNGRYETEDWFFCSIAQEYGVIPYLNTKVIVDHIGQYNYRLPREIR